MAVIEYNGDDYNDGGANDGGGRDDDKNTYCNCSSSETGAHRHTTSDRSGKI